MTFLLPGAQPAPRAARAAGAAISRRGFLSGGWPSLRSAPPPARRSPAAGVARALLLAASLAGAVASGDELAVYRAVGAEPGLFDQYDNDGYSLGVTRAGDGTLELSVRVSAAALASRAPFPAAAPRDATLPPAADRDAWASALVGDARTEAEAVSRILEGIAASVRYDADRSRRQDPGTVFASRRAHCVGFAELAVDLLRRAGLTARTVQGVLRTGPEAEGYDSHIGGVYHRWIEVYYADRGFVFSDPSASINGVDARYIPFGRRALERPRGLTLTSVETSGRLDFPLVRLPNATLRVRPVAK